MSDRDGDGAGPQREDQDKGPDYHPVAHFLTYRFSAKKGIFILLYLIVFPATGLRAQYQTSLHGLSLLVDIGAMSPSDGQANFYNGAPSNVNTLERILYSETYGNQIWNDLTTNDLIGSSIGNYRQITVAEYGDMYYRLAIQLGMGFRYDLDNQRWAWSMRFNYAKLNAVGQVLLNSGIATAYLTDRNRYVVCPTLGTEERIFIDLGLIRKFPISVGLNMEVALGANLNNTKVESSDISIGSTAYSILDIWGGQSPSSYVASYDYVNQGGIGYGAFASVAVCYTLPVGTAVSLEYLFHYNRIALERYEGFSPHHALRLSVALNNFSLF